VVQALFTSKLNVSMTLSDTTTIAQGIIIEILHTTQLVFTIFMLAAEEHADKFIAPVGIGVSLFIAGLTGMMLHRNMTIRSFQPRRFQSY
jgi:aquaporin rerated protein, other eukaryote